jgi:hypothetical protein
VTIPCRSASGSLPNAMSKRSFSWTSPADASAHRRVVVVADQFDTCQMPINAADPSYESFIKNILPPLAAKNIGVLEMKTLADRGFFGQNRWDSRPTGVSALIPNRLSVQEAIHFVWSLPGFAIDYRLRIPRSTQRKNRACTFLQSNIIGGTPAHYNESRQPSRQRSRIL